MELGVLEQPKSMFSLKSPFSFFSAFRSKGKVRVTVSKAEGKGQVPHDSSPTTARGEQTPRTSDNSPVEAYKFEYLRDLPNNGKECETPTVQSARKSILIRTSSLPTLKKKVLEDSSQKMEASPKSEKMEDTDSIKSGPVIKMASWFSSINNITNDRTPESDGAIRERKPKKVTFAIAVTESEVNGMASPSKKKRKYRRSLMPPELEDKQEIDTSIEIEERNKRATSNLFNPEPVSALDNCKYFYANNSSLKNRGQTQETRGFGSQQYDSTKQQSEPLFRKVDNNKLNPLQLNPQLYDNSQEPKKIVLKLPSLEPSSPMKKPESSSLTPSGRFVKPSFMNIAPLSVRGKSNKDLGGMLYPINTNLFFDRQSRPSLCVKQEVFSKDDSDFQVEMEGQMSERVFSPKKTDRRSLKIQSFNPKINVDLTKRHASLGIIQLKTNN